MAPRQRHQRHLPVLIPEVTDHAPDSSPLAQAPRPAGSLLRVARDGTAVQRLLSKGTSTTPYVQKVVYAPNTGYYVKAYPAANGAMSVFVSSGGREVLFYVGYVLALEADYIAASRTTLVVATVSDRQCGPPSDLYVRAGQLNDGAVAFSRPYSFHSPHATGAYPRDLCATGGTQTLIVMEGDDAVLPTNAPVHCPGADAAPSPGCSARPWSGARPPAS